MSDIGLSCSMMTLVVLITLLSLQPVYTDAAGYWLDAGVCKQCSSHCSVCTHSSQCQYCVTSRWNPGQLCNYVCPTSCTDSGCEDTTGYCYECKPGTYGQVCNQDCSLCINGECDLMKCTDGCKDGYRQFSTATGYSYCFPCPSNCIKCSNTTYCTQCEQGFYRDYYQQSTSGRGTTRCTQCLEQCTQCTSNDQCPECNTECIKQGCDVSGGCLTTHSETATMLYGCKYMVWLYGTKSTTSLPKEQITQATAKHEACPNECREFCDVHGKDTTTRYSKSDGSTCMCTENDNYYEGFGHGIATGIGIVIVVGALIGVVVFFARRTKCHQTICRTKSSADSGEHHVYVNTQLETGTMPAMSNRPGYNEASLNTGVRVTISEQEVDTDKEYISLGDRQPEHHYSDLLTK